MWWLAVVCAATHPLTYGHTHAGPSFAWPRPSCGVCACVRVCTRVRRQANKVESKPPSWSWGVHACWQVPKRQLLRCLQVSRQQRAAPRRVRQWPRVAMHGCLQRAPPPHTHTRARRRRVRGLLQPALHFIRRAFCFGSWRSSRFYMLGRAHCWPALGCGCGDNTRNQQVTTQAAGSGVHWFASNATGTAEAAMGQYYLSTQRRQAFNKRTGPSRGVVLFAPPHSGCACGEANIIIGLTAISSALAGCVAKCKVLRLCADDQLVHGPDPPA